MDAGPEDLTLEAYVGASCSFETIRSFYGSTEEMFTSASGALLFVVIVKRVSMRSAVSIMGINIWYSVCNKKCLSIQYMILAT